MEDQKKTSAAWEKVKAVFAKIGMVFDRIGEVLTTIGKYILAFHKILLAIPVVLAAWKLAVEANNRLPDEVGVWLQESGEYTWMISKELAVLGPVAITAVCLLLMFSSRRTIYPWLISIFSLVLPVVLYVTNVFPA